MFVTLCDKFLQSADSGGQVDSPDKWILFLYLLLSYEFGGGRGARTGDDGDRVDAREGGGEVGAVEGRQLVEAVRAVEGQKVESVIGSQQEELETQRGQSQGSTQGTESGHQTAGRVRHRQPPGGAGDTEGTESGHQTGDRVRGPDSR